MYCVRQRTTIWFCSKAFSLTDMRLPSAFSLAAAASRFSNYRTQGRGWWVGFLLGDGVVGCALLGEA
jgi:hypothetical protein